MILKGLNERLKGKNKERRKNIDEDRYKVKRLPALGMPRKRLNSPLWECPLVEPPSSTVMEYNANFQGTYYVIYDKQYTLKLKYRHKNYVQEKIQNFSVKCVRVVRFLQICVVVVRGLHTFYRSTRSPDLGLLDTSPWHQMLGEEQYGAMRWTPDNSSH